jgi:hypothetical protein
MRLNCMYLPANMRSRHIVNNLLTPVTVFPFRVDHYVPRCYITTHESKEYPTFTQPRKPGSFTCARATAKTLVPSGHVNY